MAHEGSQALKQALIANSGIAVSKYVVAFLTSSSTMMAEAIHSTADCFNQLLLMFGLKRSAKPADEIHAFGYNKEEYFWSFIVAVVLFTLGAVFSIYEGIHKVIHPEAVENAYWIYGLLIFAIGMEARSFLTALREFRIEHPEGFIKGLNATSNTSLLVVLVEDLGAMVGLVLAFVFTTLAVFVNPIFDGVGSIVIGFILAVMSYFLANKLRKLIVGENISREDRNRIKQIVRDEDDAIEHINNIRPMFIGNNKFLLAISVDVNDDKRAGDIESLLYEIKRKIKAEFPEAVYIYIEIADSKNANV